MNAKSVDNEIALRNGKVKELTVVRGTKREKREVAVAGDLVSVSFASSDYGGGGPQAGGHKYIALFDIHERLRKEALLNVAIAVSENEQKNALILSGRGELQIGILLEEMRREGYEMALSPPRVVTTQEVLEDGTVMELEPWESITVDVPTELSASVIDKLSSRGAELREMEGDGGARTALRFEIASRCFFGLRSWIVEVTGGQAALNLPREEAPGNDITWIRDI
eukprot:g11474.t1